MDTCASAALLSICIFVPKSVLAVSSETFAALNAHVQLKQIMDMQVSMRTLSDSELAVAVYPTFSYNSIGGGGLATAREEGSIVHITFDPSTLSIPDVNYRNTTFMGVPMAPPFSIAVKPKKLEVSHSLALCTVV